MNQNDIWRCQFHLTPPAGWLNDPNGLCQYHGIYHVFFQYAPDYPRDDNKSWGHYISTDLIHWNFVGTAFYPDTVYDKDGAFSGSTLIDGDSFVVYYTGNVMQEGEHDYTHSGREANILRITSKDGMHFSKKECVLRNTDYPQNYTCHIRDPKVWKEGNLYKMVLGGRTIKDNGAVLFYQSDDAIHWNYTHDLTTLRPFGFMWECPDYFQLENQLFLSCCPQGIPIEEYRHQNYHLSGYFPMDETMSKPINETEFREWDYGFDFYAPQTFTDEKGRRILIGWVGKPDTTYEEPSLKHYNWIHTLTIPRILTNRNGIILQNPIPELKQLRKTKHELITDQWFTTESGCFDWELELPENGTRNFTIYITKELELSYKDSVLSLTFYGKMGAGRTTRKALCDKIKNIRILADCSVLEIFIQDGAIVQTTHFFPDSARLPVYTHGNFIRNDLWDIQECVIQTHPEQ